MAKYILEVVVGGLIFLIIAPFALSAMRQIKAAFTKAIQKRKRNV